MKLRTLDLFAGIGGFSLGLERTGGFETVAFCEIEKYPQKVLAKHWPGVPIYDDVRELTAERLASDGIGVDVITGGFPCQDISNSGKGAGIGGDASENVADTASQRRSRQGEHEQSIFAKAYRERKAAHALAGCEFAEWGTEPDMGRVADGVPQRSHRLKGLGNAVVPQIPELIGRAILAEEATRRAIDVVGGMAVSQEALDG